MIDLLYNFLEVIIRAAMYLIIIIGGYVLFGALSLRCSVFASEDDTWKKCIRRSWINTLRMRPPYDSIEEKQATDAGD